MNTADIVSTYNDVLSIDIDNQFNNKKGTLSVWMKPNYEYSYASNLQTVTLYDSNNIPIFTFTVEYDAIQGNYLMLRAYDEEGYYRQWTTEPINYQNSKWQHFSATWEEDSLPKLFFQGNEMAIIDVSDIRNNNASIENTFFDMQEIISTNTMHIGESGNFAYVDEFKLFNQVLNEAQILEEYLATEPVVYDSNEQ